MAPPRWTQIFFDSPITICAIVALGLSMLFRIGISQRGKIDLPSSLDALKTGKEFIHKLAGQWNLQREILHRASSGLNELLRSLISLGMTDDPIRLEAEFDQSQLVLCIQYQKEENRHDTSPLKHENISKGGIQLKRQTMDLHRYADEVKASVKGVSHCVILHFQL